jgi:acetyl/propionyl-CoA carboxylase alpha subunit
MSEVILRLAAGDVPCEVTRSGAEWLVAVRGQAVRLRVAMLEPGLAAVELEGRTRLVRWTATGSRTYLHMDGFTVAYEVGHGSGGSKGGDRFATDETVAPMPGAVTHVYVEPGDTVRPGQPLAVVEAMKMEHVIRAPRAGVVRAVRVRASQRVDAGAVVVEIDPIPPDAA